MTLPFKIAVIGCGWVSSACHGPAYLEYARSHADVILSACCDIDPRRAEDFRDQFGFQRAYTNYVELLEKERPQAVALNVPPQWISAIGCDILQRGYPLLSEKPPGLNLVEIDRLIAAARSSGVIHQVAFNRRFTPLTRHLKRMLDELGPATIQHIQYEMVRVARADPDFSTTAIHGLDLVRFLAGGD